MAPAETPQDGIDRERDLLNEIQDAATVVLDTSDMSFMICARKLIGCSTAGESKLAIDPFVFLQTGRARGIDMIFDYRFE